MKDASQGVATDALRSWGFWTFKAADAIRTTYDPKTRFKSGLRKPEDPGRADMICAVDGKLVFVEVKNAELNYPFNQWEDHQKAWAWMIEKVFRLPYWFFLEMGVDNRGSNPDKYPRRAWLMPRAHIIHVENLLSDVQKSIPYRAEKGMKRAIQDNKWDAITLFADYELIWSKGVYTLPDQHPFKAKFNPPMTDLRKTWKDLDKAMKSGDSKLWLTPLSF